MSDRDSARGLVSAIESGDEATIRTLLTDEVAEIGSDETYSQDAMVESMLNLNAALAEMEYTIRNLWHGDDDTYILHLDLTGTFDDPFILKTEPEADAVEIEPTGDDISGSFVYLLRFDDEGDIAGVAGFDDSEAMREMGIIEFAGDQAADA